MNLMRVTLPWSCFGLEINRPGDVTVSLDYDKAVITGAAPIAAWCIGKPMRDVEKYWKNRGATVEFMQVDTE